LGRRADPNPDPDPNPITNPNPNPNPNQVAAQLRSTRDARTSTPFTEWLWGGMQYQLEHHLFPTMPRYRCEGPPLAPQGPRDLLLSQSRVRLFLS
jgi:hypothetical protein